MNSSLCKLICLNKIIIIRWFQACVHVSTAYANCDKDYIEEKVYPPPIMPYKILDAIEYGYAVC